MSSQPEEPAAQTGEPVWRVREGSHSVHLEHPQKGGFGVVSKPAGYYAASLLNALEAENAGLRRENFILKDGAGEYHADVEWLEQENAGLKAALEEIVSQEEYAGRWDTVERTALDIVDIARKALNPKKEQGTDG